jgi:hypothetical protein
LDEIVQSKLLKMMPSKIEEQKSANSSKSNPNLKSTKPTPSVSKPVAEPLLPKADNLT